MQEQNAVTVVNCEMFIVCGYDTDPSTNSRKLSYWVNGAASMVASSLLGTHALIASVFVSGNDVYASWLRVPCSFAKRYG